MRVISSGPWKVNGYGFNRDDSTPTGRRIFICGPDSSLAEGFTVDSTNGQVCEIRRVRGLPDAKLIAAAPDMLAALRELVAEFDATNEDRDPARDGLFGDTGGMALARQILANLALD